LIPGKKQQETQKLRRLDGGSIVEKRAREGDEPVKRKDKSGKKRQCGFDRFSEVIEDQGGHATSGTRLQLSRSDDGPETTIYREDAILTMQSKPFMGLGVLSLNHGPKQNMAQGKVWPVRKKSNL